MKVVHHLFRVGKTRTVKLHTTPFAGFPPFPVLHHTVERNILLAVTLGHAQKFVLTLVAFLALPISKRPLRQHNSLASEVSVLSHNTVGIVAGKDIVVDIVAHF